MAEPEVIENCGSRKDIREVGARARTAQPVSRRSGTPCSQVSSHARTARKAGNKMTQRICESVVPFGSAWMESIFAGGDA